MIARSHRALAAMVVTVGVALSIARPAAAQMPVTKETGRPTAPRATGTPPRPAYRSGIDVTDYDLTLDLPDTGRRIAARAVLSFIRAPRLDTLVLDLVGLDVRDVALDGRSVPFTRTATTIGVPLPRGGAAFSVAVTYAGVPDDGLIIATDATGRWTAFGDNWPNRARHWIPSVDHPSDKATVSWTVRAPSSRTVIANGEMVSRRDLAESGRAGWTEWKWRESRPIATYLMVVGVGPMSRYDLGETACGYATTPGGCVPQSVYVFPEQRFTLPGAFGRAADIVRFFAQLVGPFPYEKLAHVQSATRYGGMENASAIFYADEIVRRDAMSEGLIAHETAHQWFGDAVTEREWPHVWLSEGFATYFAALWAQHAGGDSAFHAALSRMRATVLEDTASVPKRPVIDTIQTDLYELLDRNSYEKGGFVLHMLHRQVGDSAFFQGLRAYLSAHMHGTALTGDLQGAIERASGQKLDWFFDQWLRKPGYPQLAVDWRYDAGARRVVLSITQSERFGAYRFPLTVSVTDRAGVVRRARVEVPAEHEARFTLPATIASEPASVIVDPDVELLAAISTRPQ